MGFKHDEWLVRGNSKSNVFYTRESKSRHYKNILCLRINPSNIIVSNLRVSLADVLFVRLDMHK